MRAKLFKVIFNRQMIDGYDALTAEISAEGKAQYLMEPSRSVRWQGEKEMERRFSFAEISVPISQIVFPYETWVTTDNLRALGFSGVAISAKR